MTVRIKIQREHQCLVVPETGTVLLAQPNAHGEEILIEFGDTDAARGFVSNALDALVCVAERDERAYA